MTSIALRRTVPWKIGVEIELMAPGQRSRQDLAKAVSSRIGGRVQQFFHPQSEPSKVPGRPVFENLTPGFRVVSMDGTPLASFVDDVTLQYGLNKNAPPLPGWYRIVSDDARFLQLICQNCNPDAPLHDVLAPLAALFGTRLDRHPGGMCKVVDSRNVSVAIATDLPGERQRPCEIITAPMQKNQRDVIELLLATARELGFTLPREGATHIHFDASPLMTAGAFSNLVRCFGQHGQAMKQQFATNPHCVRLGPWPKALRRLVERSDFSSLPWSIAVEEIRETKPTKYCDFNILNMVSEYSTKQTFEVRILPSYLDAEPVIAATDYFSRVLAWCADPSAPGRTVPVTMEKLADELSGIADNSQVS